MIYKDEYKMKISPRASRFAAAPVRAQGGLEVGGGVGEVVLLASLPPHQGVEVLDPPLLPLEVAHLVALVVHHCPDICQTGGVIRTWISRIYIYQIRNYSKIFFNVAYCIVL